MPTGKLAAEKKMENPSELALCFAKVVSRASVVVELLEVSLAAIDVMLVHE